MEPDELLCSRNARPQKALVGRAQEKLNQPPSLEGWRASLEGSLDARNRGSTRLPSKEKWDWVARRGAKPGRLRRRIARGFGGSMG